MNGITPPFDTPAASIGLGAAGELNPVIIHSAESGWEKVKDCPEKSMLNYPEGPCCVEMPCHGTGEIVTPLTDEERDRVMEQMYDELDGFTEKDWPDDVRTCASDALTLDGARVRKVQLLERRGWTVPEGDR